MAYLRTKQWGEPAVLGSGTTASATADFPGYGVSVVTVTSSDTFCLEPPIAGRRKTIVIATQTTTIAPEIWASTVAGGGAVSFAGGTGTTIYTKIKCVAAGRSTMCPTVIELLGRNSTQWIITNVYPVTTATTATSMVGGAITLSS